MEVVKWDHDELTTTALGLVILMPVFSFLKRCFFLNTFYQSARFFYSAQAVFVTLFILLQFYSYGLYRASFTVVAYITIDTYGFTSWAYTYRQQIIGLSLLPFHVALLYSVYVLLLHLLRLCYLRVSFASLLGIGSLWSHKLCFVPVRCLCSGYSCCWTYRCMGKFRTGHTDVLALANVSACLYFNI